MKTKEQVQSKYNLTYHKTTTNMIKVGNKEKRPDVINFAI